MRNDADLRRRLSRRDKLPFRFRGQNDEPVRHPPENRLGQPEISGRSRVMDHVMNRINDRDPAFLKRRTQRRIPFLRAGYMRQVGTEVLDCRLDRPARRRREESPDRSQAPDTRIDKIMTYAALRGDPGAMIRALRRQRSDRTDASQPLDQAVMKMQHATAPRQRNAEHLNSRFHPHPFLPKIRSPARHGPPRLPRPPRLKLQRSARSAPTARIADRS